MKGKLSRLIFGIQVNNCTCIEETGFSRTSFLKFCKFKGLL